MPVAEEEIGRTCQKEETPDLRVAGERARGFQVDRAGSERRRVQVDLVLLWLEIQS